MPKAKYIGNPAFRVHTQSGELLRATGGRLVKSDPATYRVQVDSNKAPHAVYVIRGTRIMLGRDVVWSTMSAPATKQAYMRAAVKVLGKGLRSQAAVRFTPDPQGSMRLTILAMKNATLTMHAASVLAVNAMGERALKLVRHNMSLTDHTLDQLAAMGHPYARRHGSIQIHN